MDLSKLQRYSTSFNGDMDEDTYGAWCEYADVQALAAGADAGRPTDSPPPDPATPDAERIAWIRAVPVDGYTHCTVDILAADRDWLCDAAERTGAAERVARSHEEQLIRISKAMGGRDARHSEDGTIAALVEADAELRDRLAAEVAGLREAIAEYSIYAQARGSAPFGVTDLERAALASGPDRPTTTGE